MAHPDPLRLRILKNLCAALEQITIANGYRHDLNGRVFRGRDVFGENDPMPMVCVLEHPIPLEQIPPPRDSTASSGTWELVIQGFLDNDRQHPTDPAHYLMADVKKRLVVERRKSLRMQASEGIFALGNAVTGLRIGAGVVRPPDDLSAAAYFWLTISLDVVEDLDDPYGD